MPTIDALSENLTEYLDLKQIRQVRRAYFYAEQAHDGQRRKSGEPYVTHPLAVAAVLSEMHMDHQSLMAAMLHDVIEDTEINYEGIESQFGKPVADIVDGVSKLTHLEFETKAEAQAENFQKMVLAMAEDIRVILVKLADRLHNMRTLGAMPPVKQRRIARETLDIYAPIAARLGMRDLQVELEDLAFQAFYPMRARYIRRAVVKARGQRRDVITQIEQAIQGRLDQEHLPGIVTGREKHLYSIYRKMKSQNKSFNEIMDVFGFRIVTETVDDCYRILGAVHNLYKPLPGRFKDYIAIPKANGYQSLHTALFGSRVTIEVQIRTREMDAVASQGIAEHSHYKVYGDSDSAVGSYNRARKWVQGLLEMQRRAGDSMEFIEHVKKDLFPDEVYVFTPKGRILELPRGATPVDFAYAVHTDIGNSCVSCRINRRLAPLSEPLVSGQTVEVITTPRAQPNMAWLNFVVTGKARASIRHFLKNQQRHESVELGRRLLNQFMSNYGASVDDVDAGKLEELLKEADLADMDALLEDIGMGNRMAYVVARRLRPDFQSEADSDTGATANSRKPMAIQGAEGTVLHYARCCHPIPGDSIVGHISTGRGLVVHRTECRNIGDIRQDTQKCIFLEWSDSGDEEYSVALSLELESKRGMIAQLAMAVASAGANLLKIDSGERDGQISSVQMELTVYNRVHLAQVIKELRRQVAVNRITRQ
ncbi:GTP pyrophosphokinase, (p)ppGpp synthetase II [Marinobacterium lacunae]|uniref:guanosine-3',5'-bis(diphosphate) 3'-diphosphatase n=1 Tax=Marinobacterium lacunae TaxID=1232683 RepID=A0A081FYC4_9GAMM|nr:RelA/SpoT family protein [Marinobacterium lacunae]KEA63529.1 GTP pyrophosphokinase, (p)ppGpp synthetase II [Marinobacterium lacunae]MBR9885121.1 RelA/SpoT family protein [Oceanospirillales bacterium]